MYKYIDPFEETYELVEEKREWIPEWFYKWFNNVFGRRLGTIQPFREILHQKKIKTKE